MIRYLVIVFAITIGLRNMTAQNDTLISFVGVGDMMLGTDFPKKEYLPPNNNPRPYISEAIPFLQQADVTFGNMEACLLDEGPVVKQCKDTTKCYAFKMPEHYAPIIKEMGFDFLSLANNHIRDFGQLGMQTTRYHLNKMNIAWAGLLDKPTDTIRVKGIKVGMAAFSPNRGTVDINDLPGAINIVRKLKKDCDIVIISFHGGAEGADHQHVTREKEVFYGENRSNVYEFAHAMIDAGADIIFGHGPHITRAMEIYKNRFIIYSLGNFATYSRFNLSGPNGLTPILKIYTNRKGEFVKGEIIPFKQIKNVALTYDHSKAVIYKIKDLTKMDFPELNHRLIIEPNGNFSMPFERKMQPKGIGFNLMPLK
ncbi:capsule synthesis protein PGA_cap [Saccharicrinis carchari]|uniref:Capsule synthesis protein PGA_cap n=1 Tax=Saccharicrinis carchari TaxID=1168039 RepID=A0A521CT03_SACCC|nr:CapA family protein [Saccharicrinis carchari]SMO61851.1 capsule synthesis protein PGA_cap [Saccharicrinis carchari]